MIDRDILTTSRFSPTVGEQGWWTGRESRHPLLRKSLVRLLLLFVFYHFLPITSTAQYIGYLSYDSVLTHMPQYVEVTKQMDTLRKAYDAEMQRVEEEFNQKYEAFLEGRHDFPRTILLKRQTELQQLLQRNVEFKEQCRQELGRAHIEALQPLRQRISDAIAVIARRHHLLIVVNTDADATPFMEPEAVINISEEVLNELISHN